MQAWFPMGEPVCGHGSCVLDLAPHWLFRVGAGLHFPHVERFTIPNLFIWGHFRPAWVGCRDCCPFTGCSGEWGPERGRILSLPKSLFLRSFLSWVFCCSLSPGMPHFLWHPCLFAGLSIFAPVLLEILLKGEKGDWGRGGACIIKATKIQGRRLCKHLLSLIGCVFVVWRFWMFIFPTLPTPLSSETQKCSPMGRFSLYSTHQCVSDNSLPCN